MTNAEQEEQLIKAYRKMREIYKDDDLMLINPKNYQGYDIRTGHRIVLKEWEVLDND